jgi:excisionase family DNA binding protein
MDRYRVITEPTVLIPEADYKLLTSRLRELEVELAIRSKAQDDEILSVKEAAVFMKLSPRTIFCMLKAGMPHHKPSGSAIRFMKNEILEWIKNK